MSRSPSEIEVQSYRADRFDGPRIDEDWVKTVVSRLRSDFSRFRANCDKAERLVADQYPIRGIRDMDAVRLPILYTSLRASVLHLKASKIDIGVKNRGESGDREDDADQIERFLENTHAALDTRFPCDEMNLYQMGKFSVGIRKIEVHNEALSRLPSYDGFMGDGRAWRDAVDAELDRRLSVFPFQQTVCDPRDMMWDHVSAYPRWVVWERMVPSGWLQAMCPGWESDRAPFGDVRLTEIWTETQFALWANEKFAIPPRRHPLGMIPFVFFHEINDEPGQSNYPESRYSSRQLKSEYMVRTNAQLLSLQLAVAQNAAVPMILVKGDGPKVKRFVEDLQINPRTPHQMPSYADIEIMPTADTPRAIETFSATIENVLAQMHYTSPVNTAAGSGAQSGYMLSNLSHLMQQNLIAMGSAWERGLVRMNELLLRLVQLWIRGPVSMFGTTHRGTQSAMVSGRMINGQYETTCDINADTPEEASRRFSEAMTAALQGWLPTEDSYRHAGLPNPARLYEKRVIEDVSRHELVRQAQAQGLLQRMMQDGWGGLEAEPQDEAVEAAARLAPVIGNQGQQGNVLGANYPNIGQFGAGNQAGASANAPGQGLAGTETPYVPGSAEGIDLLTRQRQTATGDRIRPSS